MPRIFGHRGAPAVLPENTLEGFQHAIELGADGLEIDLLLTRDGVPVVTHNPRLAAETTRDGAGNWLTCEGPAISDLTLEELHRFDVGGIRPNSDHAQKHPHQAVLRHCRIPTLVDVLGLVKSAPRDIELLVELKHSPTASDQVAPERFVQIVGDILLAHDLAGQSYLHAFNWQILSAAARNYPMLRRSHLSICRSSHPDGQLFAGSPWLDGIDPGAAPLPDLLAQRGAAIWSPYFRDLDRTGLNRAQALGLQVMTWTLNGPEDLGTELISGVDGLITDDPGLAVQLRAGIAEPHGQIL